MGKTKVVLDTNVLISSLLQLKSNERQIYSLALAGEIKLYLSKPLLDEVERVLSELLPKRQL
ncbi:putative toxin-antitoxin system toxin component, PIN family [Candidatus Aerophobetes bacterium]|nr:putative toxin-antitoxin system toxin component, PIN family [Candidatus Aerophobetes bacterium]